MAKFESGATKEEVLRDINMTLEEYEADVLPNDIQLIVLYEALCSAYHYLKELEE